MILSTHGTHMTLEKSLNRLKHRQTCFFLSVVNLKSNIQQNLNTKNILRISKRSSLNIINLVNTDKFIKLVCE